VLHAARCKCRTRKTRQKSSSGHHPTTLSGYIFATKACIDNRKKNLLRSNISSTCPHNMVNFGPLVIDRMVWVYRPGAVKIRNFATICQVLMYHTEMFGFVRSKYSKIFPKFTKRVIGLLSVIRRFTNTCLLDLHGNYFPLLPRHVEILAENRRIFPSKARS